MRFIALPIVAAVAVMAIESTPESPHDTCTVDRFYCYDDLPKNNHADARNNLDNNWKGLFKDIKSINGTKREELKKPDKHNVLYVCKLSGSKGEDWHKDWNDFINKKGRFENIKESQIKKTGQDLFRQKFENPTTPLINQPCLLGCDKGKCKQHPPNKSLEKPEPKPPKVVITKPPVIQDMKTGKPAKVIPKELEAKPEVKEDHKDDRKEDHKDDKKA